MQPLPLEINTPFYTHSNIYLFSILVFKIQAEGCQRKTLNFLIHVVRRTASIFSQFLVKGMRSQSPTQAESERCESKACIGFPFSSNIKLYENVREDPHPNALKLAEPVEVVVLRDRHLCLPAQPRQTEPIQLHLRFRFC